MASGLGGTIKLGGADEYRKSLSLIKQELREAGSALNAISSSFANSDKSEQAVINTTERYNSILAQQKNLLSSLDGVYANYSKLITANKEKISELTKKRDEEAAKLESIKQKYGQTSPEYEKQAKVVLALQKEIDSENKSLDRNTKQMSSVKTTMNDTETAINKTTKEMDSLGKETEETGKEAKKAADGGFTVMKGALANLVSQGITAALDGLKKLAGAVVNLGKNAVENFANYEQLIGGVETLFGESAGFVENYANNAYKTAGLSANQYMETITGFSASLMQSLGGDTAKAAEVGDMAIKDMSDNANKMGTSMEFIQNAYQGFAKQNYTMLDNLKLGYGGTKTEMERLLADAEKITGIHYDIGNLNDVFNAIHVIQGELQITGTTAKEAEKTIEGSMNATKSAWQNLLTGLAKGGDLTPLVNNLVESVINLGKNLIPVVQNVIKSIGPAASKILTTLVPQIIELIPPLIEETLPILIDAVSTVLDAILDVLPRIIDALSGLIPQILSALLSALPKLIDVGLKIILALINGITQSLPQLIAMMPKIIKDLSDTWFKNMTQITKAALELIKTLAKGISDALPDLIDMIPKIIVDIAEAAIDALPVILESGVDIIFALIEGIIKALPRLVEIMPQIIFKLATTLVQKLPELIQTGVRLVGGLIQGLMSSIGSVVEAAGRIVGTILQTLWELPGKLWDVGVGIVQGIWDGIIHSFDWIKNKISEWVGNVTQFIMHLFGINSPSKLFRDKVGKPLAEGIGVGFSDEMKNVTSEMKDAIPTSWDVEGNLNSKKVNGVDEYEKFTYTETVNAFKEALAGMTVEMDDENMGRFVRKTVEKAIYA